MSASPVVGVSPTDIAVNATEPDLLDLWPLARLRFRQLLPERGHETRAHFVHRQTVIDEVGNLIGGEFVKAVPKKATGRLKLQPHIGNPSAPTVSQTPMKCTLTSCQQSPSLALDLGSSPVLRADF